ncbi:MAG: efflux RND transporter periplasmic adaptor subunit [Patescibacteria group bacterium]
MNLLKRLLSLPRFLQIFFVVLILSVSWFGYKKVTTKSTTAPIITTAPVEKGTLIVSLTASGQVSAANSASVSTQTSGVVKTIFVQNGQEVKSGDKIAEVELDMDGKQRAAQAYASYQGAKTTLDNANTAMYTLQSDMFTKWKTFTDFSTSGGYDNADGTPNVQKREEAAFISTNDNWLATEAKYKTQQQVIAQAQTSLSSAWASYQQASPIVYAPISGIISGLSLQVGSVLTAQTGSSGNSASQRIATIKTTAAPTIIVNLTEIDVTKVSVGNSVTVTLDAITGKTFTGKVISIDSTGSVSSGVTTYPAVIKLDTVVEGMFANMSAQANIITAVKDEVLLIPVSAVQTANGQSTVRVMKNNKETATPVEVGLSSTTQSEIVSGLSEGDTVVTSVVSQATKTTQTTSVFGGGGIGGGNLRVGGR